MGLNSELQFEQKLQVEQNPENMIFRFLRTNDQDTLICWNMALFSVVLNEQLSANRTEW